MIKTTGTVKITEDEIDVYRFTFDNMNFIDSRIAALKWASEKLTNLIEEIESYV
jgi:hypothetical protein